MKSLWTLIALWTLSGTAWAQEEPAPQEPETPQEPELEIPDIGAPSQPGMEEVLEAIEQVRQTFVAVDKAWTETRSAVDDAVVRGSESDPEGIDDKLATGLAASEQLIDDLEKLLELLPEGDQNQQQQQQQQNEQQQQQQQQQESEQQNQDQNSDDEPSPDDVEGNRQAQQPAPGDVPPDAPPIFLAPGSGGGSWGHLPPRLQQTLQNSQAEDLPLRYRGLLEQFHKRRVRD